MTHHLTPWLLAALILATPAFAEEKPATAAPAEKSAAETAQEKEKFHADNTSCFHAAKEATATVVDPQFKLIYEKCMTDKGYRLAGSGTTPPGHMPPEPTTKTN